MINSYPDLIIVILRDLSEGGAIIYGGASIIIRRAFKNMKPYRSSIDIDIKKLNKFNVGKSSGPTSQFDPKIEEVLSKYDDVEFKPIQNNKASLTKSIILKYNNVEYELEFYSDSNANAHEVEEINGIKLARIEKVLADKLNAIVDKYISNKLHENNNIRHLIDILFLLEEYEGEIDFDILINFLKEKFNTLIKISDKLKTKDNIRSQLLIDSINNFSLYLWELYWDVKDEDEEILNIINHALDRYSIKEKILTRKKIKLLEEVIYEIERNGI